MAVYPIAIDTLIMSASLARRKRCAWNPRPTRATSQRAFERLLDTVDAGLHQRALAAFVTKSQCHPKPLHESKSSGTCAARQHCSQMDSSVWRTG